MSDLQQEMMQKWMAFATPGDPHHHLSRLEGDWTASTKFWMGPGSEPSESKGQSKFQMVMGGRYLQQGYLDLTPNPSGKPFEGFGITAFDNFRKEFITVWIDSMGTGVLVQRGKMDDQGHVQYKGTTDDVFTDRRDIPARGEAYFPDDDTHILKMWSTAPDGTEYLSMEIEYKRVR